jgi:hypothetical protein
MLIWWRLRLQGYGAYTTLVACLVALILAGCAWLFWRAKHGSAGLKWWAARARLLLRRSGA